MGSCTCCPSQVKRLPLTVKLFFDDLFDVDAPFFPVHGEYLSFSSLEFSSLNLDLIAFVDWNRSDSVL
jgi:hypothetical protein